jgi:Mg-chelatase subunit ChlD
MEQNKNSPASLQTTNNTTTLNKNGGVQLPGLHARLRSPQAIAAADPSNKENRIALLLDASGSMSGQKIVSLRDAVASFINNCDFSTTALAIETFGDEHAHRVAMMCVMPILLSTAMVIPAEGGTPLAPAMDYALMTYSMTRAVCVSDGQPDSEQSAYDSAAMYREAGVPIDCVHIGNSSSGEECLRRIAELTGGKFIKFTDIASFSKNFKMLTPAFYGQLTAGNVSAAQLGARELK